MDIQLKEELINYKDATIMLIKALEEHKFDSLEVLLEKRQGFINNINSRSYTKGEFIELSSELELSKLEDRLIKLMNEKLEETKKSINEFSKSKSARKSYNNKFSVDPLYYNKKI